MGKLKSIAVKPLVGELGLCIYNINQGIEDEIEYGYSNNDEVLTSIVDYDLDGRPYFMDNNNEKQYLDDFIRVNERDENISMANDNKISIYESLTDTDIESLGQLNLTEDELSIVLNMFELVSDEQKDDMMSLVSLLFSNKKLVPVESEEEISASEKYTRMLLNGTKHTT